MPLLLSRDWCGRTLRGLSRLCCFGGHIRVCWRCKTLLDAHRASPRVYAHASSVHRAICFHPDLLKLHPKHVRGILLHEFGHIMAGTQHAEGNEVKADDWLRQNLGVDIQYDVKTQLEVFDDAAKWKEMGLS